MIRDTRRTIGAEHQALENSHDTTTIKMINQSPPNRPLLYQLNLVYLHCIGSFFGVPLQQLLHQGNGLVTGMRDEGLQVGWDALGEAKIHSRC